ncbi:MAG: hypothetical protein ACUVUP_03455 [Thermaceae bacterium]
MLQEALVEGILKEALGGGAGFAELYVECSKKRRMLVRNSRLEEAAKMEGVGQDLTWQLMDPLVEAAGLSFAGA